MMWSSKFYFFPKEMYMKGMFVLMRFDPQSPSEPETFLPLAKTLDMTVRPIEVSFMVSF